MVQGKAQSCIISVVFCMAMCNNSRIDISIMYVWFIAVLTTGRSLRRMEGLYVCVCPFSISSCPVEFCFGDR